jgi:hypothetical protein|tara:strand:- start:639 stop:962 length:324 start_codon:yes stop_codon:yes gene_type:complete
MGSWSTWLKKLWSVGSKGARSAYNVGKKASRHWGSVQNIGAKVKEGYDTASQLYHSGKEVKSVDDALKYAADFQKTAKREQKKAKKIREEVHDIYKDVRDLIKTERG